MVGLLDVAPTLIARAGAEIPRGMQGIDLAARPIGERPEPNRMVFSEEDHEGNVLRNLSETQSVQIAEMRKHADAQQQLAETGSFEAGEAELSDAEREALCNLGYIECD